MDEKQVQPPSVPNEGQSHRLPAFAQSETASALPPRKGQRLLISAPWTVAAVLCVWVCYQVVGVWVARLASPLTLDPLSGAITDHCVRVLNGLAIYVEPDATFVPLIYTPGYYYIAAGVMGLVGESLVACKITSLGLMLLGTAFMASVVWKVSRSGWAALLTIPIVLCGYTMSGYFFDYPRVDPAEAFMIAASLWASLLTRRGLSSVLLGVLLTLAFWCKQTAGIFTAVFLIGLLCIDWKRAIWAGIVSGTLVTLSVAAVQHATEGWFWVFLVEIPRQHDLPWERCWTCMKSDWWMNRDGLGPLFIPGLFVLCGVGAWVVKRRGTDRDRPCATVFVAFAAAAVYTIVSRTNMGASTKELLPLTVVLGAAVPVSIWRIVRSFERSAAIICSHGVCAFLMCALVGMNRVDRSAALMDDEGIKCWQTLHEAIELRASEGQVWVPWGYVTTRMDGQSMRPNHMALMDYLGGQFGKRTDQEFPKALGEMIRHKSFSAIFFIGRENSKFNDLPVIHRHYTVQATFPLKFTGKRNDRTWIAMALPISNSRPRFRHANEASGDDEADPGSNRMEPRASSGQDD